MPKIKVSDFIKKYNENNKVVYGNPNDFYGEYDKIVAENRKQKMLNNILGYVRDEFGNEKFQEVIQKGMEKRAEKDKSFDSNAAFNEYKEAVEVLKVQSIIDRANQRTIPNPDKILNIIQKGKITLGSSSIKKYAAKKFLNECYEAVPELREMENDFAEPGARLSYDELGDYIVDAVKDETLDIDIDQEMEEDPFVFDMKEEEALDSLPDQETFDSMASLEAFKNDPEAKKQLSEIRLALGKVAPSGVNGPYFNAIHQAAEKKASALGKEKGVFPAQEYANTLYENQKIDKEDPKGFNIPKRSKEKEFKEYKNNLELKLSDNTKTGIRLVLEKLEKMNIPPVGKDEEQKVYGLHNVSKAKFEMQQKLKEIQDLEKEKNDKAKHPDYNNELTSKTKELLELKANYDAQIKDFDELLDICRKYFPNPKALNTNVDVTRNENLPLKYRKDFVGVSQINGLCYVYSLLKQNNVSIDEFIKNPALASKNAVNEIFHPESMVPNGKEETLVDLYKKITPLTSNHKREGESTLKGTVIRRANDAMSFLDGDPENIKNNVQIYDKLDAEQTRYTAYRYYDRPLREKQVKTLENLFTVGKPSLDLLEDKIFDPDKEVFIAGNSFDLDEYVNNNEITDRALVQNYIDYMNTIETENGPEADRTELNLSMNAATKAFARASLRYMQKYQIDPEKTNNPLVKMMVKAIENPKELIEKDLGIKKYYTGDLLDLTSEKGSLQHLKNAKNEYTYQKNNLRQLEKKVIEEEKRFDKETKRLKKALDQQVNKLLGKDSTDSKELVAEELQRRFKERIINHNNELAERCRKGEIPEGFFLNRSLQLSALEPIGKLKFFGNKTTLIEDEFINAKEEEMKDSNLPKQDIINLGKLAYQEHVERLQNEEQIMIERMARENYKPFTKVNIEKNLPKVPDSMHLEPNDIMARYTNLDEKGLLDLAKDGIPNVYQPADKKKMDGLHPKKNNVDVERNKEINEADLDLVLDESMDGEFVEEEKKPNENVNIIEDPKNTEERQRVSIDLDEAVVYDRPKVGKSQKVPAVEKNKTEVKKGPSNNI